MKPVIVVSGASQGLGYAISRLAAQNGYAVAMLARNVERLNASAETVRRMCPDVRISAHAVDLVREADVRAAFQAIVETHGEIGSVINNAGTWTGGREVSQITTEFLRHSLDQNFFSAFHCIQAALELRRTRAEKHPLTIVNIGATASLRGGKKSAAFSIAKGALRTLSQSLAKELGPQGVHTTHVVIDGLINNERTKGLNPNRESADFMEPESIAAAVLSLCEQTRDCWTFEMDLRPSNENWN
jgi:NAD(P)-dependent dehydrogenase (short-subunit alcohol dehydrogenase family)